MDNDKIEEIKNYDELYRQYRRLTDELYEMIDNNNALRYSLAMMYKEMTSFKNAAENWEENYYKEHNRAEKLYEELEKLKNDKRRV